MPSMLWRVRMLLDDHRSAKVLIRRLVKLNTQTISRSCHNYVALPRSEAFRIEYWALEEAKLQRMPPESEFSRKVFLVIGGGSGIGREVALLLAKKGAHLVIADMNEQAAQDVCQEATKCLIFRRSLFYRA